MGQAFMFWDRSVEFADAERDAMLASDVRSIEASHDVERTCEPGSSRPAPAWDGYSVERHPLEADLAAFGIPLQEEEVPRGSRTGRTSRSSGMSWSTTRTTSRPVYSTGSRRTWRRATWSPSM
jgi:hypothetical protein